MKRLYTVAGLYFLTLFLWITVPFSVGRMNRIDPYVLGLPFFQFCILLFLILNIVGLIALFASETKIMKKQPKPSKGDIS